MLKIRHKNKVDNCLICLKEFKHFNWDNQKYCSRKCLSLRFKIEQHCCICNKQIFISKSLFNRNNKNYCSRDCYNLRNGLVKRIKRHSNFFKELLKNSKCECGEDKEYLLQIHHIDGNKSNNIRDNLEVVCANCHIKRHLKKNKNNNWVYHTKTLTNRNLLKDL